MRRRITLTVLALCMLFGLASCKSKKQETDNKTSENKSIHEVSNLLGFVVEADGKTSTYEAMHSFICNAEEVGMYAKLYRFTQETELEAIINEVISDNCDAVLFYSNNADYTDYAKQLEDKGIRTVSLVNKSESTSCSFMLDKSETDILKLLAGKIEDGSVLIYSSDPVDLTAIQTRLAAEGCNTAVKSFMRDQYAYADAANALYSYMVNNTSVKAIYAIGEQNARPAVIASEKMDHDIIVIGDEITKVNEELFSDGLYALAVTPYYDMTARAVRAMYELSHGNECDDEMCTVHLVTEEKADKYIAIRQNTEKWFNIEG